MQALGTGGNVHCWAQAVRRLGHKGTELPPESALTVTVPGAAALWEDAVKTFGSLPLAQAWPFLLSLPCCPPPVEGC